MIPQLLPKYEDILPFQFISEILPTFDNTLAKLISKATSAMLWQNFGSILATTTTALFQRLLHQTAADEPFWPPSNSLHWHSSEKRVLRSTKCSSETLQKDNRGYSA